MTRTIDVSGWPPWKRMAVAVWECVRHPLTPTVLAQKPATVCSICRRYGTWDRHRSGPEWWVCEACYPHPTSSASGLPPKLSYQARVKPWVVACMGEAVAADKAERNHRFLEEAIELVQACGATRADCAMLLDYVFGRPPGDPAQEVGGVMVTLAALCEAHGMDMHTAGEAELARVWTKVEAIRAKHAAKPRGSPLPQKATDARFERLTRENTRLVADLALERAKSWHVRAELKAAIAAYRRGTLGGRQIADEASDIIDLQPDEAPDARE